MKIARRIKHARPRIRRIDLVASRIRRALQEACTGHVDDITQEAVNIALDYVRNQIVVRPSMRHRMVSVELVDVDKDNCSMTVGVDII